MSLPEARNLSLLRSCLSAGHLLEFYCSCPSDLDQEKPLMTKQSGHIHFTNHTAPGSVPSMGLFFWVRGKS